jgi:hypothetical protein
MRVGLTPSGNLLKTWEISWNTQFPAAAVAEPAKSTAAMEAAQSERGAGPAGGMRHVRLSLAGLLFTGGGSIRATLSGIGR